MLAREVLALTAQPGLQHVSVKCLPAKFHHFPDRIAPALERAVLNAHDEGITDILVGYADCGSGGAIDEVCKRYGLKRIQGPHCFSFYIGNETFEQIQDELVTTFFITDFLARHFETFLIRPLGLERHPDLKEMYFKNYTHALYLAQTKDPELEALAKSAAEYLGLEYAYRFTGFADLESSLHQHFLPSA